MKKINKMKRAVRVLTVMAGVCVVCMSAAAAFAGEGIMLKDVNSTNYDQYVKSVAGAYGYNKGECNRKYLPHEEHFYSEFYDHWNVDVVYDSRLIKKLYTDFEKSKPEIEHAELNEKGVCLKWKDVEGAEKYVIKVRHGSGKWKRAGTAYDGMCSYIDVTGDASCRYKVCGVKHVRLWDVKTLYSDAGCGM